MSASNNFLYPLWVGSGLWICGEAETVEHWMQNRAVSLEVERKEYQEWITRRQIEALDQQITTSWEAGPRRDVMLGALDAVITQRARWRGDTQKNPHNGPLCVIALSEATQRALDEWKRRVQARESGVTLL